MPIKPSCYLIRSSLSPSLDLNQVLKSSNQKGENNELSPFLMVKLSIKLTITDHHLMNEHKQLNV